MKRKMLTVGLMLLALVFLADGALALTMELDPMDFAKWKNTKKRGWVQKKSWEKIKQKNVNEYSYGLSGYDLDEIEIKSVTMVVKSRKNKGNAKESWSVKAGGLTHQLSSAKKQWVEDRIDVTDAFVAGGPFAFNLINEGTKRKQKMHLDWIKFIIDYDQKAPVAADSRLPVEDDKVEQLTSIFEQPAVGSVDGPVYSDDPVGSNDGLLVLDTTPGGTAAPVPEPATMVLMGAGLLAMGGTMRARKKKP